jgi:hypothetical protein
LVSGNLERGRRSVPPSLVARPMAMQGLAAGAVALLPAGF